MEPTTGGRWKEWLGWGAVLLGAYASLVISHYALKDPDSTLYEAISSQLAKAPFSQWLQPVWPEGRWKQGPFQEHLAIFFWPGALLERAGLPRGALLANLLSVGLNLWALCAVARELFGEKTESLCLLLAICSPLFLQYLIRANQEPLWSACTLWALYGLIRSGRQFGFAGLFVVGAGAAFLIKGVLALLLFPAAAAWLGRQLLKVRNLAVLAGGMVLVIALGLFYEAAYRAQTGTPFFASYLGAQLGYSGRVEQAGIARKLFNLPYYLGNALAFAAPASLFTAHWIFLRALPSRRQAVVVEQVGPLLRFVGTWLLCAALPSRSAARYGFPAYQLIFATAAAVLPVVGPSLAQRLEAHRSKLPWVAMGLCLAMVVLRCIFDPHTYHFINLNRVN